MPSKRVGLAHSHSRAVPAVVPQICKGCHNGTHPRERLSCAARSTLMTTRALGRLAAQPASGAGACRQTMTMRETERRLGFAQTTPFFAGLGVATAALGARGLLHAYQAWKLMPPKIRQFYQGGFEADMSRREAALILGLR